jgi:hypothetical protein
MTEVVAAATFAPTTVRRAHNCHIPASPNHMFPKLISTIATGRAS